MKLENEVHPINDRHAIVTFLKLFFFRAQQIIIYFANEYRAWLFCIHDGKMNVSGMAEERRTDNDLNKDRINSMYGLRQRITALDGLTDINRVCNWKNSVIIVNYFEVALNVNQSFCFRILL